MTDAIRTPDELTRGLPEFPFEPNFVEVDGIRVAYVDEDRVPLIVAESFGAFIDALTSD